MEENLRLDVHDDKLGFEQHIHIGFTPLIASRTIPLTPAPTAEQLKEWFGIELPTEITTPETSLAVGLTVLIESKVGVVIPDNVKDYTQQTATLVWGFRAI